MPNNDSRRPSTPNQVERKAEEADFLVETFDVPVQDASDLLTDGDAEATRVRDASWQKRQRHNPLKDRPVPKSPDEALPSANDEVMQKNVVRVRKNRP